MKILTVVGARPNFIKLAALHTAFGKRPGIDHVIVHTGQHYDYEMSEQFFRELHLPDPDYDLGVGPGTQAEQIGRTMMAVEPVLKNECPDWVVVVGDVNATVAAAMTAKYLGLQLAHVEAGLRSFDWTMPEEINRIMTDHLSDLLFASEPIGVKRLHQECIEGDRVHFVGNVMIDTLLRCLSTLGELSPLGEYAVATLHRPSNIDADEDLMAWMHALEDLAKQMTIFFPVHPRTRQRLDELAYKSRYLWLLRPLGYLAMIALMRQARIVLTDSGGIQEETTALGVPCLTLRENTERPITVHQGTNHIVGGTPERLRKIWDAVLASSPEPRMPEKWDGRAAERIATILEEST